MTSIITEYTERKYFLPRADNLLPVLPASSLLPSIASPLFLGLSVLASPDIRCPVKCRGVYAQIDITSRWPDTYQYLGGDCAGLSRLWLTGIGRIIQICRQCGAVGGYDAHGALQIEMKSKAVAKISPMGTLLVSIYKYKLCTVVTTRG